MNEQNMTKENQKFKKNSLVLEEKSIKTLALLSEFLCKFSKIFFKVVFFFKDAVLQPEKIHRHATYIISSFLCTRFPPLQKSTQKQKPQISFH
jgi:hypothetical protein